MKPKLVRSSRPRFKWRLTMTSLFIGAMDRGVLSLGRVVGILNRDGLFWLVIILAWKRRAASRRSWGGQWRSWMRQPWELWWKLVEKWVREGLELGFLGWAFLCLFWFLSNASDHGLAKWSECLERCLIY